MNNENADKAGALVLGWYQGGWFERECGGKPSLRALGQMADDIAGASIQAPVVVDEPPVIRKRKPIATKKPAAKTAVTSSSKRCSEAGCGKAKFGRGLCSMHYFRVRKAEDAKGAPATIRKPKPVVVSSPALRFDHPLRAEGPGDGKRNEKCPAYARCSTNALRLGWPSMTCGGCGGTKKYAVGVGDRRG